MADDTRTGGRGSDPVYVLVDVHYEQTATAHGQTGVVAWVRREAVSWERGQAMVAALDRAGGRVNVGFHAGRHTETSTDVVKIQIA